MGSQWSQISMRSSNGNDVETGTQTQSVEVELPPPPLTLSSSQGKPGRIVTLSTEDTRESALTNSHTHSWRLTSV